jgi:hypothetical protein
LFQLSAGALQLVSDEFFVGQDGLILGGENLVGQVVEGIMSLCGPLLSAKEQADGRILTGFGPVLASVIEVEVHLAGVMRSFA